MLTKDQLVDLINRDGAVGMHAIGRALVHLRNRQTSDEVQTQETRHHNCRGFRPCHARMGTSMANFYERNNYLSPKQQDYWRRDMKRGGARLSIYWKQLGEEAQKKQALDAAQRHIDSLSIGAQEEVR